MRNQHRHPRFESLESRQCPAAVLTAVVTPYRILDIEGTESSDVFAIHQINGEIAIDGIAQRFPLSQFDSIGVRLLGGDDRLWMNTEWMPGRSPITVYTNVSGGPGNDEIVGSAGPGMFSGGDGNDRIWGHGGNDYMHGDAGDDYLAGGEGNDSVNGDEGHDEVTGDAGNDTVRGGAGNDRAGSREALARFRREIQAAARLSHPNVVVAHDATLLGDTLVYAMEYVEGIDLARLVQERGPLPVGLACECARQAVLGLAHAHGRGLVHRDIKPANLMLTHSESEREVIVKILDLGLGTQD